MSQFTTTATPNQRLKGLLRPYWKAVLFALTGLVLLTAVNLAVPMLIGSVFNRVFPDNDWRLLFLILGTLLVLFLLRNLFFYGSKKAAVRVGEDVCFHLRRLLFERLQQLQLIHTRSQSPGKTTSKVMNDTLQIQQFISEVLPKSLQAALLFSGIVVVIYAINWQLALAATFVLPLHLYVFRYFGRRIKGASRRAQEHVDFATGSILESLLGVEVVKAFTGEERDQDAFREAMQNSRDSHIASYHYVVLQKVSADLLIGIGMLALIAIGTYQVIGQPPDKAIQAGDFIAFFWYIRLLYPTVIDMMSSGAKLSKVNASIERVFELLEKNGNESEGGSRPLPQMRGKVEFEHISFSFDGEHQTLEDISFCVEPGRVCAITGHSGAGKSTLTAMVPLLLRPNSGIVKIDDIDSTSIRIPDLRRNIGVVFQECFLFNTSILENLRYAKPHATNKEIIDICRLTGADEFIRQLPDGYRTVVGESVLALSRGQKQLITVTRAILKNPKILILDEATASLDHETEKRLLPTILEFMRGRTTLMITHNPGLLKHADMDVELSQGRLIAKHQHTETNKREENAGESRFHRRGIGIGCLIAAMLFTLPAITTPTGHQALHAQETDELELFGSEVASKRLRLSYIDPARCLKILKLFGVNTKLKDGTVDSKQLPTVVAIPSTSRHETIPATDKSFPMTESDPLNELIVFYNSNKEKQLSDITQLIRDKIDIPAQQIMIEAMVLEISETGLDRLGVEWQLAGQSSNFTDLQLGDVKKITDADNINDQLTIGIAEAFGEFNVNIRALVSDGDAEVLSRPSVLTLDNRMAYINVARKIPIAETRFSGNQNVSTVNFREEIVGIQLAVRPRINNEGREVSMQVNASVSAVVPNEEVEVLDSEGTVVAKAPTISVREVKTYARIANHTPFIIGGLVSRDDLESSASVPLLGDIPLLGRAFQSNEKEHLKREVIVVITPFVLPKEAENTSKEREKLAGRVFPKGKDTFDSFGNNLFRDAYRIRDEDVFELDFLIENEQLNHLQDAAEQAIESDEDLRQQYPFSEFVNGRIPGERFLVYRQMYEVINRTDIDQKVSSDRLILFDPISDEQRFDITFLEDLLLQKAQTLANGEREEPIKGLEEVWETFQKEGKALAITYSDSTSEGHPGEIMDSPIPEIRLIDLPNASAYEERLWELNQKNANDAERHTILLREESDLQRLKRTVVLRHTVDLNAVESTLTLENFSVGRFLMLPTRDIGKVDMIDGEVAHLFFITELYYDALREELRRAAAELKSRIKAMEDRDWRNDRGPRKP